jgi:hypothetical protein
MCCAFVYSVINLIWNKQYVFFIKGRVPYYAPSQVRVWALPENSWQAPKKFASNKHSSLFCFEDVKAVWYWLKVFSGLYYKTFYGRNQSRTAVS